MLVSNGSRIVGEILRHDTSVLKIKTSFAGTLEIKWKDILEVSLTEPGTVLLRDGQTLEIQALSHEGDQFILYPVSSDAPLVVAASEVKTFEAEAWELGEDRKRTGRINLAVEDEKGNTEKREFDLDGEFHSRWGKNHLSLFGQLEYDTTRGITSADNWTVFANFDHTFSGKWYYSIALLLQQDRFKDLKLRSAIGPALGYRFYDSRRLYHRHISFAAANESGKFLWRSWSGVRAPLFSGVVTGIEYEVDYDSEPAVRTDKTDTTIRLKLGYEWK